MADKTSIQWTDASWNPTTGCSRVSAGCDHCYAMHQAHKIEHTAYGGSCTAYDGTTRKRSDGRTDWTGVINLHEDRLGQPLRWRRPRRVFVDSMSDLFHPAVPFDFIDRVFAVMALAERHTFQILTKRPERMAEYMDGRDWGDALNWATDRYVRRLDGALHHVGEIVPPLPNVWLGTSVEDQASADERIPHLLRCPAAVRFLSCEPLLGPVDLNQIGVPYDVSCEWCGGIVDPTRDGRHDCYDPQLGIDWIIIGGESGRQARPCNVGWMDDLIAQCKWDGVPVFVKQLGSNPQVDSRPSLKLTHSKGGDPDEWPADLRVREFPEPAHAMTTSGG